jgi:hypothetical protein
MASLEKKDFCCDNQQQFFHYLCLFLLFFIIFNIVLIFNILLIFMICQYFQLFWYRFNINVRRAICALSWHPQHPCWRHWHAQQPHLREGWGGWAGRWSRGWNTGKQRLLHQQADSSPFSFCFWIHAPIDCPIRDKCEKLMQIINTIMK